MIMEAETNRWLRGGAGLEDRQSHTHTVKGWLRKLPVVETFDLSCAEIIVLVNFRGPVCNIYGNSLAEYGRHGM